MDDDEEKLKRSADELGIGLVDLETVEEQDEVIENAGLRANLRTKGKLRRLIREAKKPPVFVVCARVKGALNSHGARGNVYKVLEEHNGSFSQGEGQQVRYDGDDLAVKAYFEFKRDAMAFQSAINRWEIHKEIAQLHGVEIDPPNPDEVRNPQDLTRYYLQHYIPSDSESPCFSLNQLQSYRLSVPVTESVAPTDPVAIYQSLDVCVGTNRPYKCHLKDKARFRSVARNQNNLLAASWNLHQMLDGLNNMDSMSVLKLSVVNASEYRLAEKDNRFRVTLQLEFYHELDAKAFQPRPEGARRINEKIWHTTVYVQDKVEFSEFVAWKSNDTQEQWDGYAAVLEGM
mmetsp:Transcript_19548/g.42141  ORF Transcript_19548/g.42141 Transcript_19548/m.42141 type:complete len:345 (-) Transcript_19548:419-1453(-)